MKAQVKYDVLYMVDIMRTSEVVPFRDAMFDIDKATREETECRRRFHRRGQLPFVPQLHIGIRLDDDTKSEPYPVDGVLWDDTTQQFEVYLGCWVFPDDKYDDHLEKLAKRGWLEVDLDVEAQD